MRKFWKYFVILFSVIGFVVSLFTVIFYSQDTSIKLNKTYALAKRMIGFGGDYTSFTANTFNDYLDIIIRGQKYNLGINKKEY